MKQFTKILNNIAFYTQAYVSNPCCEALSSFKNSQHIRNANDAMLSFLNSDQSAEKKAIAAQKYSQSIEGFLNDLIKNFCDCKAKQPVRTQTYTGSYPSSYQETRGPRQPIGVSTQEYNCFTELDKMLRTGKVNAMMQNYLNFNTNPTTNTKDFINAIASALESFKKFSAWPPYMRGLTFISFLNELCKFRKNSPVQYEAIQTEWLIQYAPMSVATSIIDMASIRAGDVDAPPVSGAMCLPVVDPETEASLNQYGIGAGVLAACVIGAGFFGGAVGIRAFCRMNKAGKAAAIATCAAAAASQTGSAAVNANNPAVRSLINNYLDKLCEQDGEGGLFECEESTQGGGDEGDGPVDPPGGGEVGGIGGGIG